MKTIYFIFGKLAENNSQPYEARVFNNLLKYKRYNFQSHFKEYKNKRILDLANYSMLKDKKFWSNRYNMSGNKCLWLI